MNKFLLNFLSTLSVMIMSSPFCSSQDYIDLRKNFTSADTNYTDTVFYSPIDQNGRLDYISPLKSIYMNPGKPANESIFQLLSMVQDEKGIEALMSKEKVERKDIPNPTYQRQLIATDKFLSDIDSYKVVMLNESHVKVQTRAFILSILPHLKQHGYTHLAMETLNYGFCKEISVNTGYYTMEPIMGEIVRTAIRLGFILVPYEDTSAMQHTPQERETFQANNLWNSIRTSRSDSKYVVISGYSHIAELPIANTGIKYDLFTMAMELKRLSAIDPFTINQVSCIEEDQSDDPLFAIIKGLRKYVSDPRVLPAPKDETDKLWHFDAFIVHPMNRFEFGRPIWLTCGGTRKKVGIPCGNKKSIIVQAYYKNEIISDSDFETRIPADQSFYLDRKNTCHLYLVPGNQYFIVQRDETNKIIQRNIIEL